MQEIIPKKYVLHITNWYPNIWNSQESLFIKEHFLACINYTNGELWHIQVRNEGNFFKFYIGDYSSNEHYIIIDTIIDKWRIKEILTLLLLFILRVKLLSISWDIVNIHIAYPILSFLKTFICFFGSKIIIIEHWSAYHYNFFLKNKKSIKRIRDIFHNNIPIVTVSCALMDDIKNFSGKNDFKQKIIPNVVDPKIFYINRKSKKNNYAIFLMAGIWSSIKLPLLAMNAFRDVLLYFPNIKLRIIGCGKQLNEMKEFVINNKLENSVYFIGSIEKKYVAYEMRNADCFIHASKYETFSSVCAEALCCGIPVIASSVGGIPEFIDKSNGILVHENNIPCWTESLIYFMNKRKTWSKRHISHNAKIRFNPQVIGSMFLSFYDELI